MSHTLLLADDSLAIQRVIELTFASEDVRVVAVGDGQQAIDRLLAERPDIVLADIAMPLADGYAVAEFVRATPAMRDVPVLLLAGAFDVVEQSRLAASGARGVLVKPFEPHVVIGRVRELLGLGVNGQAAPASERARLVTPAEPPRAPRTLSAPSPEAPAAPVASSAPAREAGQTVEASAPSAVADRRLTQASDLPPPAATDGPEPETALADVKPLAALSFDAGAMSSLVDDIAARVVDQLGDRLRDQVSDMVLTMSERLVREEIARIRAEACHAPAQPADDAGLDS